MKYSVLIADDEANARNYLSRLVASNKRLHLLGTKANGLEVVQFCKTLVPDVLLLDIEMPGLNGIETARKVMSLNPNCLIVFTTAYNEYAISAFKLEAIGYLLKPFTTEDFGRVMDRSIEFLEIREKANFNDQIERLWEKMRIPERVYLESLEIKDRGLVQSVRVEDILYIKSSSEYVELVTLTGSHLYRISLDLLSQQLPPFFHRIHRSYLINNQHVAKCQYQNNGTYDFLFPNDEVLTSSRSYQEAIQAFRS
ncbi:LytR/AlgR family response regulator transcription factor [Ekhidna sp. To15]|uniref:LytR/AlgR family response regulator transcription factor n=1 Tax=Ekhidna sp. To15 TaxID=3395267 RepID=UPI003F524C8C